MNLLDQIKEAGIIGAGGAGFPTHAKLAAQADYILLNGAECEPLLRVDQQLMERFSDEIIRGFAAAGRLVQAGKALIGIKEKHQRVIVKMRERIQALQEEGFVEVHELSDVYPAGDEQVLVFELTGRVVPEAGIPIQVGCVVVNAETALNIDQAMRGKPVTETYITLAGDIPGPLTFKAPVGMPVADVLAYSGLNSLTGYKVIDGGPMMGPVMHDTNGYITKKNKGFVILKEDHPLIRKKTVREEQAKRVNRAACEQCRMCTDLCPRYLLGHNMQPHKTMRAMNYTPDDLEGQRSAALCSQCGLCEMFSCPAGLYPKQANLYFKDRLAAQNIRYQSSRQSFEARPIRKYRQIPSKRLIARLGLSGFDRPAPLTELQMDPPVVRIATRQHVGLSAAPVVGVGDRVNAGQVIAVIPAGSLGAAVHASISGAVTEVAEDGITIRRD